MSNTILIVEDDKDINDLLNRLLKSKGYDVTQAFTGQEALAASSADLAILDQHLPDTTGTVLAEQLWLRSIPCIFLTAEDSYKTMGAAAKSGALGYLIKPANNQAIIAAVTIAMARAKEIKDLTAKIEETAITSSAVAIIASERRLTLEQASERLDKASEISRTPKLDLARRLIESCNFLGAI